MKRKSLRMLLAATLALTIAVSPVAALAETTTTSISDNSTAPGTKAADTKAAETKTEEKETSAEALAVESDEEETLEEEIVFDRSGSRSAEKESKSQISAAYGNVYSNRSYNLFEVNPSLKVPYSEGKLSVQNLQGGTRAINLMRSLAGLPTVGYNQTYTNNAQKGALMMAINQAASNNPPTPAGMDATFASTGRMTMDKSIVARASGAKSLASYAFDIISSKGANDISTLVNRRLLLNPTSKDIGFGYAENAGFSYAAIYEGDAAVNVTDYDFMAWPASGNFPREFYTGDMPMSVSLNPNVFDTAAMNVNNVVVKITCPGGAVIEFKGMDSLTDKGDTRVKYYNIIKDSNYFGNVISFRPGTNAFGTGVPTGLYSVTISGLKTKAGAACTINYVIEFFDATNYLGGDNDAAGNDDKVRDFVSRLYTIALKREAEDQGLVDWKNRLVSKQKSGAEVAAGFFMSKELANQNISDSEFVERLYLVMMNRASDAKGKEYWLNMLNCGVTREGVYRGFAESKEFQAVCDSYNIERGTYKPAQNRDVNYGCTMFVARLYTQALGRNYDINGLNDWTGKINSKAWTVTDVSTTGFFHSQEFLNKNLNDVEYIKVLYRTFLNREYDSAGLAYWRVQMENGKSRDDVLKGFANSQEFANLKKQYGF